MKALILAAGYGTRLQKDLAEEVSGRYKHLKDLPKQLLPIGSSTLIDILLEQIQSSHRIKELYVVTNARYYPLFIRWAEGHNFPQENIINDQTRTAESRRGSVADIALAIKEKKITDDLLVVAGDTLFYPDFKLEKLIDFFDEKRSSVVTYYAVEDTEVKKRSIGIFSADGRMEQFLEKPLPSETASRSAIPPLYIYHHRALPLVNNFLAERSAQGIDEIDAPGRLLAWLCQKEAVYGLKISGRFDVGSLKSYLEADGFFRRAGK